MREERGEQPFLLHPRWKRVWDLPGPAVEGPSEGIRGSQQEGYLDGGDGSIILLGQAVWRRPQLDTGGRALGNVSVSVFAVSIFTM